MELTLENLFGITQSTVNMHPKFTFIAGYHGAGKSTTLTALQSLVTGEGMPIPNTKKNEARRFVNDKSGAKSAKASLKWSEGYTEVRWPPCKVTGTKFKCSPYAAGLIEPSKIPAKDLSVILDALPTKDDLVGEMAAMFDQDNLAEIIEAVWKKIETEGWDAAHTHAVNRRKDLKRDWAKLANQDSEAVIEWSVNSKEWLPVHHSEETLETLQTSLSSAKKIYEHTIKHQALNDKAKEELEAQAKQIDDKSAEKAVKKHEKSVQKISADLEKTKKLRKEIPQALNPKQTYQCWNCNEYGCIEDDKLVKPPAPVDEKEQEALKQKIEETDKRIRELEQKRSEANIDLSMAKVHMQKCEVAKKQLKTSVLDDVVSEPTMSPEDARREIELCEKRILAYKIHEECQELDGLIRTNDFVCAILDPNGLRRDVLVTKLSEFNETLALICERADWPKVEIDEFFSVLIGGYLYKFSSKAQRRVADVALQIAIAKNDGSQILILDECDLLKGDFCNGLLTLLEELPLPAVLAFAFGSKEQVPAGFAELGSTYWCEDGQVSALELVSN